MISLIIKISKIRCVTHCDKHKNKNFTFWFLLLLLLLWSTQSVNHGFNSTVLWSQDASDGKILVLLYFFFCILYFGSLVTTCNNSMRRLPLLIIHTHTHTQRTSSADIDHEVIFVFFFFDKYLRERMISVRVSNHLESVCVYVCVCMENTKEKNETTARRK